MLFACFPSSEIYLLSFVVCMLSKDVVCMLSQNKNIFLPLKHIENINKNIFNNFLITAPAPAPAPYFFKNCQVSHPHPNLETHSCFIGYRVSLPWHVMGIDWVTCRATKISSHWFAKGELPCDCFSIFFFFFFEKPPKSKVVIVLLGNPKHTPCKCQEEQTPSKLK